MIKIETTKVATNASKGSRHSALRTDILSVLDDAVQAEEAAKLTLAGGLVYFPEAFSNYS